MTSRVIASSVRSLVRTDADVTSLLDFLPVLYPGGQDWLPRALSEVRAGSADGLAIEVDGQLAAVLLGKLKRGGRYKIRTLFVAPEHRGMGLGRKLLVEGVEAAKRADAREIYVTVASTVDSDIAPLLRSEGFELTALEFGRYGAGRDELIYTLRLDS